VDDNDAAGKRKKDAVVVAIANAPRKAQLVRIRQRAFSIEQIAKDIVRKERQTKNTTTGLPRSFRPHSDPEITAGGDPDKMHTDVNAENRSNANADTEDTSETTSSESAVGGSRCEQEQELEREQVGDNGDNDILVEPPRPPNRNRGTSPSLSSSSLNLNTPD
jgi:hypothetical protein